MKIIKNPYNLAFDSTTPDTVKIVKTDVGKQVPLCVALEQAGMMESEWQFLGKFFRPGHFIFKDFENSYYTLDTEGLEDLGLDAGGVATLTDYFKKPFEG